MNISQNKFYSTNRDILDKLKSIDFDNLDQENLQMLNYLDNSISKKLSIVHHENHHSLEIENVLQTYCPENIKSSIEKQLNLDIKNLTHSLDTQNKNLSNIVQNQKNIDEEYSQITKELNLKENEINQIIDFYSDYLKNNKNFLIRNEILKNFLEKIVISKEDKDNLVNKNLFDEKFFKLIEKMNVIKENITIIERNSEKFSKNLIFSIKENYNIFDDLLNEKIVLYLKNLFRTKKVFSKEDYFNTINTIRYIRDKENYLNFILKEYTQMRKKLVEEQLKNKYLKVNKIDEVFKMLIEDFEIYFLKEFIILFTFFNNEKEIFKNDEMNFIFELFNFNNINLEEFNSNILGDYILKIKQINSTKDFNFYVDFLNPILYILEQLFYENINYQKNLNNYEQNLSELYKITILTYFYISKIEIILKSNNFSVNENLNLFSMINNYKKNFTKNLSKILNENLKNLQKMQKNTLNYLKEDNLLNNENMLNKNIGTLVEHYSKIFDYFSQYSYYLTLEDRENLSPKNHNPFKLLVDYFSTEAINTETNIIILLKMLNLVQIIHSKLSQFKTQCNIEDEIKIIENNYDKFLKSIYLNLTSSILKATKLEESLAKNISHEQTISIIEHILEKSIFN